VQNIDLDSQITEILGPLQDPDDFNVTFHETQTDATMVPMLYLVRTPILQRISKLFMFV